MRGPSPLYFPVPRKGLIANVPPHEVPPDALTDGSFNVYIDIDGLLKARQGYSSIASNNSGLNPKDYPIGMLCYRDAAAQVFITIVQGINTWQYFAGTIWNNITGANVITGSFDLPARFATLFQGGNSVVYGINGVQGLFKWIYPAASITPVPTTINSMRDICSLANRVVGIWTTEAGVNYPFRVRWSAVNDGTTWPPLAFADLPASISDTDNIIAIRPLNRLNAAIYREESIWIMTAVPGVDATAFQFELAPNAVGINGPVNAAAIVPFGGVHYYYGSDGRIWQFDGINAFPISDAIDAISIPAFNANFKGRAHGTYLATQRQLWFFFPTKVPFAPQPTPWFGAPTIDYNVPSTAIVYDLRNQCFLPLMSYVWDNFTTSAFCDESSALDWTNWVPVASTWPQVPYTTWASIPATNSIQMYVGTEAGYVMRWFNSPTDNGFPVAYNATWGLRAADNLTQNLKASWIECYLRQIPQGPNNTLTFNEAIEADLRGFIQPLDNNPVEIMALAIALADQSTFFSPILPGPLAPANLPINWMQFRIQGSGNPTSGNFVFAGTTLYCNVDQKPDYQSVGGTPTR